MRLLLERVEPHRLGRSHGLHARPRSWNLAIRGTSPSAHRTPTDRQVDEKPACRFSNEAAPFAIVTRWIALAVLAAVGATMLITWPAVEEETGPQKAASLYGFNCKAPCAYGPSYVAYRVSKLYATDVKPGSWAGKPINQTPAIGAIASFGGNHVAFVENVLSKDTIEITELTAKTLTRRTVTRGHGWPRGFILLGPRPSETAPGPGGR